MTQESKGGKFKSGDYRKHQLLTTKPICENEDIALIETKGHFNFVALISEKLHLAANLRITFLRNGPPGSLIKVSGDLDNRLKTVFDALTLPNQDQIAKAPPSIQAPDIFFCLLQDDSLIHNFQVAADRLLDGTRVHAHQQSSPKQLQLEVLLIIQVITRTTELIIGNMDL